LVTYTCNPSYLGGRDWEDFPFQASQANSWRDPHLQSNWNKIGGVAQVVECLLCKYKALSSTPVLPPPATPPPPQKKKDPRLAEWLKW
jgi:hypothetical protein